MVGGIAVDERGRELLAAGAVLPDAPFAVPASTDGRGRRARGRSRPRSPARSASPASAARAAPPGRRCSTSTAGASADLVVELGAGRRRPRSCTRAGRRPAARRAPSGRRSSPRTRTRRRSTAAASVALDRCSRAPASGGLAARFLLGPDGPIDLDLVADGPHAIVGGTTGSGKSALLTAWILALAAAHPPERLVLLLVDCKGGATFDPLAALPHVAGVVTDLDPEDAERAVASLGAELRRREQAVRDAGGQDITATGLPRLVVVVDEYRALVDRAPDLAALFGDLAARGRSLGVHLVLCTQRPAGQHPGRGARELPDPDQPARA